MEINLIAHLHKKMITENNWIFSQNIFVGLSSIRFSLRKRRKRRTKKQNVPFLRPLNRFLCRASNEFSRWYFLSSNRIQKCLETCATADSPHGMHFEKYISFQFDSLHNIVCSFVLLNAVCFVCACVVAAAAAAAERLFRLLALTVWTQLTLQWL